MRLRDLHFKGFKSIVDHTATGRDLRRVCNMRYPVAIESGTETEAFGVVVPDLPGCFSAGDTMEEAMATQVRHEPS